MALKTVKLQVAGLSDLIMHNVQLANPLNKYTRALKKLTVNRNKTEADHVEISRLEWEGGLYMNNGEVAIPSKCVYACLLRSAKGKKQGPSFSSGCSIVDDYCPLTYSGPKIKVTNGNSELPTPELDKFYPHFSFQTMVVVQRKTILRTRPLFQQWSFVVAIDFDDKVIDKDALIQIAKDAGKLVGLGDWRPLHGRFTVTQI